MQTVTHLSRRDFRKLTPDNSTCVISINNSDQDAPDNIWHGWRESLILFFDDAEDSREGMGKLILFSEDHAEDITDFVRAHGDCDTWIVHCEAGISRSAAVAEFVSLSLNLKLVTPEVFFPNPLVRRLLKRKLWGFTDPND